MLVDNEQATLSYVLTWSAFRGADSRAIKTRQVPNQYIPTFQGSEGGCQTETLLPLKEDRGRASIVNPDDGRSGSLQVGAVVEIGNDDVACMQQSTARKFIGDKCNSIGVSSPFTGAVESENVGEGVSCGISGTPFL